MVELIKFFYFTFILDLLGCNRVTWNKIPNTKNLLHPISDADVRNPPGGLSYKSDIP